jgi:transposase
MVAFCHVRCRIRNCQIAHSVGRSNGRAQAAEIELAQARALASCMGAMIQEVKLEIARLRRDTYGISSERRARLIDQLEKPEAAATEDALAAKQAASGTDATVCAVTRRKPMRKAFPAHALPPSWRVNPPVRCPATHACMCERGQRAAVCRQTARGCRVSGW